MAAFASPEAIDEISVQIDWDVSRDIYVVSPVGFVRTEEHCRQWMRAFDERFGAITERIDMVIVLDRFSTSPEMSATWRQYRDAALRYARYCIRVDTGTDAFAVSKKRQPVRGEIIEGARTIPDAMDIILALRAFAAS